MHFHLARLVEVDAEGERVWRPAGADQAGRWGQIDLRPDSTRADGWCLFGADVACSGTGVVYLGDGLDEASATVQRALANRLGINLDGEVTLRQIVRRLLLVEGREDGSRWRNLRATRASRGRPPAYRIALGGEVVDEVPAIRGGAVITDDFDTADSSTVGHLLSWNQVPAIRWDNTSGECVMRRGENDYATCIPTTALDSDDHYVTATVTFVIGSVAGLAVRAIPGEIASYVGGAALGTRWRLYRKLSAGSAVDLATDNTTPPSSTPFTARLEADGSSLDFTTSLGIGLQASDSALTSRPYAGVGGHSHGSPPGSPQAFFDDFEAGDLAAPEVEAQANLTAPSPSITATVTVHQDGQAALTAPAPSLAATAAVEQDAHATLTAPSPTLAATATTGATAQANLTAPSPSLAATIQQGPIDAQATLTAPTPTIAATVTSGATAQATLTAPTPSLAATVEQGPVEAQAALTAPSPVLAATLDTEVEAPDTGITSVVELPATLTAVEQSPTLTVTELPAVLSVEYEIMPHRIKQNDTRPSVVNALKIKPSPDDPVKPFDLTGCAVKFHMRLPGAVSAKVEGDATIVDAENGVVRYDWVEGDTDTPNTWSYEWQVTDPGGQTWTFPNDSDFTVFIYPELA